MYMPSVVVNTVANLARCRRGPPDARHRPSSRSSADATSTHFVIIQRPVLRGSVSDGVGPFLPSSTSFKHRCARHHTWPSARGRYHTCRGRATAPDRIHGQAASRPASSVPLPGGVNTPRPDVALRRYAAMPDDQRRIGFAARIHHPHQIDFRRLAVGILDAEPGVVAPGSAVKAHPAQLRAPGQHATQLGPTPPDTCTISQTQMVPRRGGSPVSSAMGNVQLAALCSFIAEDRETAACHC